MNSTPDTISGITQVQTDHLESISRAGDGPNRETESIASDQIKTEVECNLIFSFTARDGLMESRVLKLPRLKILGSLDELRRAAGADDVSIQLTPVKVNQ